MTGAANLALRDAKPEPKINVGGSGTGDADPSSGNHGSAPPPLSPEAEAALDEVADMAIMQGDDEGAARLIAQETKQSIEVGRAAVEQRKQELAAEAEAEAAAPQPDPLAAPQADPMAYYNQAPPADRPGWGRMDQDLFGNPLEPIPQGGYTGPSGAQVMATMEAIAAPTGGQAPVSPQGPPSADPLAIAATQQGGNRLPTMQPEVPLGDVPPPLPGLPEQVDPFYKEIAVASEATGVPPELIASVVMQESTGDPLAIGNVGEIGLMQVDPDTLPDVGMTPDQLRQGDEVFPDQQIMAGAQYLRQLFDQYGSWEQAVLAYNGGMGNMARGTMPQRAHRYQGEVMDRWRGMGGGD